MSVIQMALIPLAVRRKPSDQLVLKMLAAHFPRTYGEKVDHQHTGIISVVRIGLDGKMRPNAPPRPKLEDQTDGLVASADSDVVEPSQMKIGLVVGEPKTSAELEAAYRGMTHGEIEEVEFVEEDDEAPGASSPPTSPGQS